MSAPRQVEEMLSALSRAEDLVNAWAYVRSHRPEIEDRIRANQSA
jgi:hypothetical protein